MVEGLSDLGKRPDWELRILIALSPALMTTTSSASPEVARVYERARQLAQRTGQGVQFFQNSVWIVDGERCPTSTWATLAHLPMSC